MNDHLSASLKHSAVFCSNVSGFKSTGRFTMFDVQIEIFLGILAVIAGQGIITKPPVFLSRVCGSGREYTASKTDRHCHLAYHRNHRLGLHSSSNAFGLPKVAAQKIENKVPSLITLSLQQRDTEDDQQDNN
jgi:hypothetical protein